MLDDIPLPALQMKDEMITHNDCKMKACVIDSSYF